MKPLTAWSPGFGRSKPFGPPEGWTPNQPRFMDGNYRGAFRAASLQNCSITKSELGGSREEPLSRPLHPAVLLVASLGSARRRREGRMRDVEGCVPGNFNDGVRAVGPSDLD